MNNFIKYKIFVLIIMWCYDAHAVRWPSISEPMITSCWDNTCTSSVEYKHSGTVFLELPELIKPPRSNVIQEVRAYGIHCERGSKLPGREEPFSGCSWSAASGLHSPPTRKCALQSDDSWEFYKGLDECITDLTWGAHTGAGPGGECVLFGIYKSGLLYTPMGIIDAITAANSGSNFCVKPLPPQTKCDFELHDTVLDHGVLNPDSFSTATVTGYIECGDKPVIDVVGGKNYIIAPGINGELKADVDVNSKKIIINSRVTTANAKGGNYTVSKVIVVSPW